MYVVNRDRQISLMREMTQLRKDSENWEVYYHHPTTNEMWKSYFPRAGENDRGPRVMRPEPVSRELPELLERCLGSDLEDDAMGLALELSVVPGRWEEVVDAMECDYRKYRRSQLRIFVRYLGIEDYRELFEEIGYDPEAHGLDAGHFDELRRRVKRIRLKRFLIPF